MSELEGISQFIKLPHLDDSIPVMEDSLEKTIGYSQRVGELLNQAEFDYRMAYAEALNSLRDMEEETETTRKAKLEAATAQRKLEWSNLKTLNSNLKALRMALMQAIKTRREEPH